MPRRLFAWIIAATLGLSPLGLHGLRVMRSPDADGQRVAPQPVRDDETTQESTIEFIVDLGGSRTPAGSKRV